MNRWILAVSVAIASIVATPVLFAVTPANGGMVGGTPIVVDASSGNQTDPHVSGDLAVYTDEFGSLIRYYDLFTNTAGAISTPFGSIDQLSDVNGVHISFARKTGPSRACMVFDVSSSATVQIGPSDSGAFSSSLGSDTVAFVSADDIVVGRISTPAAPLTNLSVSPDLDFAPAVSPDGNAVVWQACDSPITTCAVLKSIFSGSWGAAQAVAVSSTSPDTDGVNVVYDSFRASALGGGDIYFQALAGGSETQLALDGAQRNPSISGDVIAFESMAPGDSSADLFIYRISTNTLYQVTSTPTFDEQLNDLTVLPDGSVRMVWAAHPDTSPDNDIYAQTFTVPADTTAPAVTITTPPNGATFVKDQSVAASYSCQDEPGGSGVASCTGTVANGAPIDTAAVGSHSFTVTGTDNAGNSATVTNSYNVGPPVSSKLVFSSNRDGNFEIYSMNADGSGQTRLTANTAIDGFPAFSADGTKIVFASSRTGNGDIYVMNADGSGQTRLTTSSAIDGLPAFSPDGSKIVFASSRTGNGDIYVMNADGSSQTRLTTSAAIDAEPSWSPDGTKIVFTSTRTGNGDIYVMNTDGSAQTRLTTSFGIDGSPDWSADGTKITFASSRDGNFEIYSMNADGSGQTRLTSNPALDGEPVFLASGKIVFTSIRDGNLEIYSMNADGSGQTRLTTRPAADSSPDGP